MAPSGRAILIILVGMPFVGACSKPVGSPPSKFISAVDLDAITKAAAPKDVTWGAGGSRFDFGVGSSAPSRLNKESWANFRCPPESLDGFLKALQEQLQSAVTTHGGEISSLKDSTGQRGVNGFRFKYVEGPATGNVRVSIEPGQGEFPRKLTIKIYEPPEG